MQKYILHMLCKEPGKLLGNGGSELHGLVFQALAALDAGQATSIHESSGRGFVLGPLQGPGKRSAGFFYCEADKKYYFTISVLEDGLQQIFDKFTSIWEEKEWRIGSARFIGIGVEEIYPGGITPAKLLQSEPLNKVTLKFYTPTSFRSQGVQLLFPQPELTFNNLRRRWNEVSHLKLTESDDFTLLMVSGYNLRTHMLRFNKYNIIGFTGYCSYSVPSKAPGDLAFQVGVLSRFAELAGVGYKSTMGMGQVKIIKRR